MSEQLELVTAWCPPAEFLIWKELPGAGLVMEAYYRYAAWDFRRFRLEGVKSSVRFIEERVRDDIRCGKKRGIELAGYKLNSHLTKPILMHMLTERPEWLEIFEVRDKKKSQLPEAQEMAQSTGRSAQGAGTGM